MANYCCGKEFVAQEWQTPHISHQFNNFIFKTIIEMFPGNTNQTEMFELTKYLFGGLDRPFDHGWHCNVARARIIDQTCLSLAGTLRRRLESLRGGRHVTVS